MSEDLTARVAELAAAIEAKLAEEYAAADMLAVQGPRWLADKHFPGVVRSEYGHAAARCNEDELAGAELRAEYIARYGPGRAKRSIKATRDLVAVILGEQHDYIPGDEFYSCSQAIDPYPGESGEPGSGCADDERAGKPCDCGRDQRVARLLGIIASEWEES